MLLIAQSCIYNHFAINNVIVSECGADQAFGYFRLQVKMKGEQGSQHKRKGFERTR